MPLIHRLTLVTALLCAWPVWSQTTAKASLYEAREKDWRNGAIVYQILVDRFAPSADLDAKKQLYPAPKVLREWH